jgi:hypothetical protein
MTDYCVIDPYPSKPITELRRVNQLIKSKVESVESAMFEKLTSHDILFIDSSHVIRTGGDVTKLFLHIIPMLPKDVLVHVHDVFTPYDYPISMIQNEMRFWDEQYILEAYLLGRKSAQIVFGSHYMSIDHPHYVQSMLPRIDAPHGCSFWFRT